ncbi:hypothetical protein K7G98_25290 [Saccharothrix sp. MB29]|nr:hypothetical protein [Saccharothrix sp. MB29]
MQSLRVNGAASTSPGCPRRSSRRAARSTSPWAPPPRTGFGAGRRAAVLRRGPVPARSGAVVGLSSKCLDVPDSVPANGVQLQLYTCNTTAAQRGGCRRQVVAGRHGSPDT